MFGELFKDIKDTISSVRYGQPTRVITVAKPFCSPARILITSALQPYGIKVHDIRERMITLSLHDFLRRMKVEARTWENLKFGPAAPLFLPMAWHAKVIVNEAAAAWTEYVLLRTGKLYVPGKYVDPRNEQWAARHGGKMPPAWRDGNEPMIESSCNDGKAIWKQAKMMTKGAR
jgi:hypothetical protein